MKYIGLDLGTKTLGVALSDSTGLIAHTYKTIRHNEDYNYLVNEVKKIVKEESIDAIVLGLPKNMNNTIGPKGELCQEFKNKLENKIKLPVYLQDERLTTVEATNILIEGNVRRKKRKSYVDQVAATLILQEYLDRKDNK